MDISKIFNFDLSIPAATYFYDLNIMNILIENVCHLKLLAFRQKKSSLSSGSNLGLSYYSVSVHKLFIPPYCGN